MHMLMLKCILSTYVNIYHGSDVHCENNVTLPREDNLVGYLAIKLNS